MAEKVLENPICETCGVDVRPQALFCYNCGGAVSDTVEEKTELKSESNGKPADAGLIEFPPETEVDAEAEAKMEVAMAEEFSETPDAKIKVSKNSKLKSAAAMRRKAKSLRAKPIEVVWEEPENFSSVKLILVVLLLTLFAVGIVILALYLK